MANTNNEGQLAKKARLKRTADLHKGSFFQLKHGYENNVQKEHMARKEMAILQSLDIDSFKPTAPTFPYESSDEYATYFKEAKIAALELFIAQKEENNMVDARAVQVEAKKIELLEEGVDIDNLSKDQVLSR